MAVSPWTFATPPVGRHPQVALAVFGRAALATGVPMSLRQFGVPSSVALELCNVRTVARNADVAWFDGWRTGSLRSIAERDLGARVAELDAADHVHMITVDVAAPTDLTYLQAAWGLARYLVARGASIVLDAHAMTFTAGDAFAAPGAALDVSREVRTIYETDSARADQAHALHTRGLRKFGAPDVIALCSDADAALVGRVVSELADAIARGTEIATPRHRVEVAPGVTWALVEDEHRLADLLQLNNTARVLLDSTGHDLVGVVGRLPRAAN